MRGFTWHQADITHQATGPRRAGLPGAFPEHDGSGPDVDSEGNERATTGPDGKPL